MCAKWSLTLQGQRFLFCSHFRVTVHFEISAPNYPKWPWTINGQRSPTQILQQSPIPKYYSVWLYDKPFSRYRPFWDMWTEWPQNECQRYLIYISNYSPLESQISLLSLCDHIHFRVTGYLETSAKNDPQMTLNTKRTKVPHEHITILTTFESHISLCFSLYMALFELQAILRQVLEWPQKYLKH